MTLTPRPIEGLVLSEVGEESIIYDSNGGKVHVLNGTGAAIWKMLDGKSSRQETAELLAKEFEVDRKTALLDLDEFINQLQKMGLVELP